VVPRKQGLTRTTKLDPIRGAATIGAPFFAFTNPPVRFIVAKTISPDRGIMTRFVSTAWVPRGSAEFEAGAALRIHAKAGRATAANPLHIYVLEGYDALEEAYRAHLRDANILLYDATALTADILHTYRALNDIATPYDVRCFVRWFVVQQFCPGERLIHFDLDLFFTPSLDEVHDLLAGCEGTFGSPCLTVATPEWLRVYREVVGRLITDREGLQAELDHGGTVHRRDIASDQDLTMALERRGGILPRRIEGLQDWAAFTNPLYAPHALGRPVTYTPGDRFSGRPVLYWHLQNAFAEYLSRFASIQTFRHPWQTAETKVKLGFPDFRLNLSAEVLAFHLLRVQAHQKQQRLWAQETALSLPHSGDLIELIQTRAWVANAFIIEGRFRELFSHDWWWDEAGFAPAKPAAPYPY
jgi:hypothetical protein